MPRLLMMVMVLATVASCDRGQANATPAGRVDSVVPWDVDLAQFRDPLPEVTSLANGLPSLEALVDTFLVRLERFDTLGLHALTMTAAEFGWLYYPTVPEAYPPYDMAPDLLWFMIEGNGRRGLLALLEERGGQPLDVARWTCETRRAHGDNIVHASCLFDRVQAPGDTVRERLFGPVIERDGRFKFVNLAVKL